MKKMLLLTENRLVNQSIELLKQHDSDYNLTIICIKCCSSCIKTNCYCNTPKINQLIDNHDAACVIVFENGIRLHWLNVFSTAGIDVPSMVHPQSTISKKATIDVGTIIFGGCTIADGCNLQRGCLIQPRCRLNNNCIIKQGALLNKGVYIGNQAVVGHRAIIGGCSIIKDGVIIGDDVCINRNLVIQSDVKYDFLAPRCRLTPN